MRDRLSTKILSNGATRYGVYDETGNLLRYEYIKLEDEPTVEGDLFSKANMLPDSIPAALGLKMENPQVKDALNVLANVGNLHVWQRVQTYAEEQHTYTLGEKTTGVALATGTGAGYQQIWYCSDEITVSNSLEISLVSPSTVSFYSNTTTEEFMSAVAGKFIKYKGHGSEAGLTLSYAGVYFCPGDSAFGNVQYSQYEVYKGITNAQIVTAVTIPAGTHVDYLTSTDRNAYTEGTVDNTTITYLGQLGGGARIEVGSYVGTGTYGKSNPNSLTFVGIPKLVIVEREQESGNVYSNGLGVFFYGQKIAQVHWNLKGSGSSNSNVVLSWNQNAVSWYGNDSSAHLNYKNTTYHYIAIG